MNKRTDDVRAMVLREPSMLESTQFSRPVLQGNDALLRVEATGLCGSDVARFVGSRGTLPPMVLGHEICGTIEEISPGAAQRWDVGVGDLVVVEEALPCGVCRQCAAGRQRLCVRSGLRYGSTSIEVTPSLWGGFAELMYLHAWSRIHRVPSGVSAHLATLFIPLSNGYGWLVDGGQISPGENVVVLGPGLHGICTAMAAMRLGAGSVTLVGRSADERRLQFAAQYGIRTLACGLDAGTAEQIRYDLGDGADIVVDVIPGPQSGLADATALLARGGRLVLAGVKDANTSVSLPTWQMLERELSIRGVWARPDWAIHHALNRLATDRSFDPLVEDVFSLEETEKGLLSMTDPQHLPLHSVVQPQSPG